MSAKSAQLASTQIVVEDSTGTTLPHLHGPAIEMIRVGWGEVRCLEETLSEIARLPVAKGAFA